MAPVADGGVVIVCNTTGVDMATLPVHQLELYRRLAELVLIGAGPGEVREVAEAVDRAGML